MYATCFNVQVVLRIISDHNKYNGIRHHINNSALTKRRQIDVQQTLVTTVACYKRTVHKQFCRSLAQRANSVQPHTHTAKSQPLALTADDKLTLPIHLNVTKHVNSKIYRNTHVYATLIYKDSVCTNIVRILLAAPDTLMETDIQ